MSGDGSEEKKEVQIRPKHAQGLGVLASQLDGLKFSAPVPADSIGSVALRVQPTDDGRLVIQPNAFMPSTPVTIVLPYPTEATAAILETKQLYESNLIRWAEQFLDRKKSFVDIGAHCGTYTLWFARLCKEVHAFEPSFDNFARLCGGMALSGIWNVTPHNMAVGEENASAVMLRRVSDDGGGSTLLPANLVPAQSNQSETPVQVTTLDSLGLKNVGFIKIDVEGGELEVLRGSKQTLASNNFPKILMEVWPDKPELEARNLELEAVISELGYTKVKIAGYPDMVLLSH